MVSVDIVIGESILIEELEYTSPPKLRLDALMLRAPKGLAELPKDDIVRGLFPASRVRLGLATEEVMELEMLIPLDPCKVVLPVIFIVPEKLRDPLVDMLLAKERSPEKETVSPAKILLS